jgi:phosphatidylserine/phosphatidylglycerophosphate/cardiolipin synthase-like enzyme
MEEDNHEAAIFRLFDVVLNGDAACMNRRMHRKIMVS